MTVFDSNYRYEFILSMKKLTTVNCIDPLALTLKILNIVKKAFEFTALGREKF